MSLDPFERELISATNDKHSAVQRPRTWFASWRSRSKNCSENHSKNANDGSFSARACYMLHGMLVIIHIILVIFYVRHWEHRVIVSITSTNNDFWPVLLSASLQAFYTIYTAVLLFLTQRLAISRTLVCRLKLTAIHDISSAWAGLGSALSSVWRQSDIPASLWTTAGVTAYLTSMSVLHVTSSTLLQFQPFNASMATSVPTTLGWLYDLSIYSDVNWGSITASLPVINQLSGMVTPGLSNTTVYDTLKTSSITGNATVNATTITSHCGLLSNVTYNADASMAYVSFSANGENSYNGCECSLYVVVAGSDQIQILPWSIFDYSTPSALDVNAIQPTVSLMVSALLEIEPSVQEAVAVNMSWEYYNYTYTNTNTSIDVIPYEIQVYFMQCSLLANTTEGVVDIQTNNLLNPAPIWQPSTQWEIYQWTNVSDWATAIGLALPTPVSSGYPFGDPLLHPTQPSIADEYIMSLVGLNLTAEELQNGRSVPPNATFVLRPDILELAVAKAAAQLIWIAGRFSPSNGGLQPGNGMAYVDEVFIALRLNINLLPLCFAASASVIMLGLALLMTRASDASHDSQAAIPDIGVLQLLWLGHRSASINEVLEDVEHPTEANLRRAGMVDVCFAKTISDEQEFGSSTDSLTSEADHGHDDEM
ncbi:hypothetical protein DEU56DRAFT_915677 [Suillus clintonianus]|uniref:uncharacterized protein n=1 Tax=Suillus clintonianus TaxID=1904413 RepID=UPI001B87D81A|nr:uncharacterized protein DEU56DRAFT_915677 [Suillus clintonianus]KAG2127703.1 hypothetical protein DEU56DRAFT_915677 [Suillus clintonianus]